MDYNATATLRGRKLDSESADELTLGRALSGRRILV